MTETIRSDIMEIYKKDFERLEKENAKEREKEILYENNSICEICYINEKCKSHICPECNNSICLKCVEKTKIYKLGEYNLKCPYCREETKYNINKLNKNELLTFYNELNNKYELLKKPTIFNDERNDLIVNTLKNTEKTISNLNAEKNDKERSIYINELNENFKKYYKMLYDYEWKEKTDVNKLVLKCDELKKYKTNYQECEKYASYMKQYTKEIKQKLEEQNKQLREMNEKIDILINNNKNSDETLTKLYDMFNNPDLKKQPKQIIKNANCILKPVIELNQIKQPTIRLILNCNITKK